MSIVGTIAGAYSQCAEKMTIEKEYSIGRFQKFCYDLFISGKYTDKQGHITWGSSEMIEELLKYSSNSKLKKEIYNLQRVRCFKDRNSSIIVKEIVGLCEFINSISEYYKLTYKMWTEK